MYYCTYYNSIFPKVPIVLLSVCLESLDRKRYNHILVHIQRIYNTTVCCSPNNYWNCIAYGCKHLCNPRTLRHTLCPYCRLHRLSSRPPPPRKQSSERASERFLPTPSCCRKKAWEESGREEEHRAPPATEIPYECFMHDMYDITKPRATGRLVTCYFVLLHIYKRTCTALYGYSVILK